MIERIISILQLPEKCLVRKKITKAFFKRNFELIISEKNLLNDSSLVVSIDWIASISPANANVPVYINDDVSFEEVQIIALQTSAEQFERNKIKLADFVQKYIPYHILLIIYSEKQLMFHTCMKRVNMNDSNKRIMDKACFTNSISLSNDDAITPAFLKAVNFSSLDKTNLKSLYESYFQQIVALQTAEIKGKYAPRTSDRTKQEVEYLEQIDIIEKEILQLQNQAKKETQMNKRIELNTDIQLKKKQIENLKTLITA